MSRSPDDRTSRRRRDRDDYSDREVDLAPRPRKREADDKYSRRRSPGRDESDEGDDRRYRRDKRSREDDRPSKKERHYSERSRSDDRSHRRRSRSPPPKRQHNDRPPPVQDVKSRGPLPSQEASFRGGDDKPLTNPDGTPIVKEKPNYKPTGLLAKEANTVQGTNTVLKYHEPPEGRKPPPKEQWRMYVFKQKDLLDTVYLHERSVWLMGRDAKVTDLLLEHPSISKQHAVIQFRHINSKNEFGDKMSRVKPYLIDLESANGSKLNGKKVEASRYVELVDGDVVAFGDSEREYVMMLPPAK